jgi:two-component system, chemotaxis family, sensor kinase CheA
MNSIALLNQLVPKCERLFVLSGALESTDRKQQSTAAEQRSRLQELIGLAAELYELMAAASLPQSLKLIEKFRHHIGARPRKAKTLQGIAGDLQFAMEAELNERLISKESAAPDAEDAAGNSADGATDDWQNPADLEVLSPDISAEVEEHLDQIEKLVMSLEEAPEDAELRNAIFRSFHTIKGIAGITDRTAAAHTAHTVETLLDLLREDKLSAGPELMEQILRSRDLLAFEMGIRLAEGAGGWTASTRGDLLRKLTNLTSHNSTQELTEPTNLASIASSNESEADEQWTSDSASAQLQNNAAAEADSSSLISVPEQSTGASVRKAPTAGGNAAAGVRLVRVDTTRLDQLVDMAGELVIAQSLVRQDLTGQTAVDPRLQRNMAQLARITSELQKTAMTLRLVPVGDAFHRVGRAIRETSKIAGKKVRLVVEGADAELDRTIVERLSDPLLHMIRNAIDHGIEKPEDRLKVGKQAEGTITLRASHQAGHIELEVRDDGRGLNMDRIRSRAIERGLISATDVLSESEVCDLIFHPGFSTAESITDVSGRGVGMDVVRKEVEQLRGRVVIRSEAGKGAAFLLRFPLTLAIIEGLVFRQSGVRYILPLHEVREILRRDAVTVRTMPGDYDVVKIREQILPLLPLTVLLDANSATGKEEMLVVLEVNSRRFALAVEEVIGKHEVVIKSLGDHLGQIQGVAGAAILGDGTAGLIIDVNAFLQLADKSKAA